MMGNMSRFHIRPARPDETGLFYTPHPEEDRRRGTIGHVRMDFGRSGNEFWHTWWPRGPEELNSPVFKAELQEVVDTMRENVLKSRFSMERFCYEHGGKIAGGYVQNYGYIVETEHYRYCLRCNPSPGDYNGYLTAYDLDVQRQNTYTIPAGITLLIPFDEAGTLYTDAPAAIRTAPASKPFRTLTMSDGASITVNGAISLGGRYYAAGGSEQGRPVGDYGYIKMAENSSITVKNGGNLYAWGFISGSGSILAESGATVYEFYQIADFRGGSASSNMGNKVFPFSQYFVQNIEVPLTLNAGANEQVYSGVYAMSTTYTTAINFIGDTGMFKVESGSFTKDYDEKADRLVFTVNGEAALNTLSLKLAGMSVNSASYVLPITNNVTINIQSGNVTINQDAALLAGVEVNIAEGAGLTVANGKNIYFYDSDEWNSDNFVWGPCKFKSVAYAPGKAYNRSNNDLVDAKMDVNGSVTAIGAIYTTKGGANICSSNGTGKYIQQGAPGTATATYQYNANGNNAVTIPITPAKLHNADGSYTETATANAGDVINYVNGVWGGEEPTELTVIFEANGSTEYPVEGTMPSQTVTAKKDTALNANTFTREGYNFLNWNTAADGTGDSYADGATVNLTENTTLYAQWEDNHSLTKVINKKDATCTEDGYTGDTVCAICGKEITKGETIQAKGHTEVFDAAVEPTCTEPGKTEGKHCSVCNEVLVAQEVIPATGHTEKAVAGKPATCTETGLTDGISCSVCGTVIKAQEVIPAKGHSWNEGEITTSPTCENAGVKTYTCTVCNATKTEAIDATGHTPIEVAEQPAICGCCGTVLRRKPQRGKYYWCCMRHDTNREECPLMPISETSLCESFCRLYYKLKHQSIPILEQMLTNLQMIRNRRMLWSPDIVALNKRISDLSSQNQTLAFLKQQGLVDPDIFIAKTNELTKQLRQVKLEKEKLMDAESDMTALQTRDLIDLLEGGPEFLDSFDAELFGELVEKIIIESNDSVRFCLKNGLELRESIERTVR